MDTILNNAVASIQIGVEDYQSDDPRRRYEWARVYASVVGGFYYPSVWIINLT